jgi:hypothetical protein
MFILGVGTGVVMQNLVLVVQNVVAPREMGAASSSVTFFRSLGGTIGVSAMGSVLGSQIVSLMNDKADALKAAIMHLGAAGAKVAQVLASGEIPKVDSLPPAVRTIVESAYGQAVADVFLIAAPLAIITIIAVCLIPNNKLGTKTTIERMVDDGDTGADAAPRSGSVVENVERILVDSEEAMVGAPALSDTEASVDAANRPARHASDSAANPSAEQPTTRL